ncbi:MAG TPA: hypothetical protein PK014_14765 [Thermoanaerobaculia bacterium]|nr:hypothetical protein [Thermoanaerobaculia bacterium]HUM31288.1 hypothetical protein [Thermoanaerobaculia bacterium]HXK69641.1 hypothetical protein [Thermoanaerobaculia bacterium]
MFNINLASRPFWNLPAFVISVVIFALITLAVTFMNGRTLYRVLTGSEETRTAIASLQKDIAGLDAENEQLRKEIASVDTRRLAYEIDTLNTIIGARALSWSTLLDHVEEVLPNKVRIISLSPSPLEDGVLLSMNCLTESHTGMLDLIDALHNSPNFSNPTPTGLQDQEAGVPEGRKFGLRVTYKPGPV